MTRDKGLYWFNTNTFFPQTFSIQGLSSITDVESIDTDSLKKYMYIHMHIYVYLYLYLPVKFSVMYSVDHSV
jgi:hypothetical protein